MLVAPHSIVGVSYRSTNYYVVCAGTTRLLVDLGYPGSLGEMRAVLGRKGVKLTDITHGLATHYHPDHAGLAQDLKSTGMMLIVTPEQLEAVPAMRRWTKPEDRYSDVVLTDRWTQVVPIATSRAFLFGLGIAGEFVHTPGHTQDSVSLLLDDGSVFTGDLTTTGLATDDDAATVVRSWATLRERGATRVYPGHGGARKLEG